LRRAHSIQIHQFGVAICAPGEDEKDLHFVYPPLFEETADTVLNFIHYSCLQAFASLSRKGVPIVNTQARQCSAFYLSHVADEGTEKNNASLAY
jgi:hypothetical protein